jgi:hypothetical protein
MNQRLKAQIRLELFHCASLGEFLTYEKLYERVAGKKMGQFPYTDHFDAIAKEERQLGYPDITFLVHRSDPACPYPSQIDFQPAKPKPTAGQLASLRKGTDEIIKLYCPSGTPNPY